MKDLRTIPLTLASQSPRRKVLMTLLGLNFRVVPGTVAERFRRNQTPRQNARRIALEKAEQIAGMVKEGIVIGADTIVVLDKKILGKPKTEHEAIRMLASLSGRTHTVFTGIALVDAGTGRTATHVEATRVTFRELSRDEILEYVSSGSPMDKAGAYGIQDDYGAVFVEKVQGCFYNVVGFPLTSFYKTLRQFVR